MSEEKIKLRTLESHETRDFVINLAEDASKLITGRVCTLVENQRWIIMARVINLIFAGFFGPTIEGAEKIIKKEQEIK